MTLSPPPRGMMLHSKFRGSSRQAQVSSPLLLHSIVAWYIFKLICLDKGWIMGKINNIWKQIYPWQFTLARWLMICFSIPRINTLQSMKRKNVMSRNGFGKLFSLSILLNLSSGEAVLRHCVFKKQIETNMHYTVPLSLSLSLLPSPCFLK